MCGIFGALYFHQPAPTELMPKMGDIITHRGPDDHGYFVRGPLAMGMRRLSIIDVSGGHQPICNEDKSVWVILNGEIFNFPELRKRLEDNGHRFTTHTDTEVLVHLYEEEGDDFVKSLRGMFAYALWDQRRSVLLIGRDRLGKKPLYVRRESNRILFASEMKSILADESVPREVDPESLDEYLGLGYVPAPFTMLKGIEKVLPGHYLRIDASGAVSDHEYWDVRFDGIEHHAEQEWIERVRAKFLESVKIRLISDVPLGAFLSGGIDSSAIVGAMAHIVSQPVKTYSIGFGGEDSFYNELPYARIVANKYHTEHHEIIVKPDVAELLPKLIWHMDEPIADSAFVTTFLVSELARKSVTVILSGVGGDELFGGYRRYLGDNLHRYYRHVPRPLRSAFRGLLNALPQDRHRNWTNNIRYASGFANAAEMDPASRYMSFITVFSPAMKHELLPSSRGSKRSSELLKQYFARVPGADPLDQNIYVDLKTSLADDLLALTDKMSMAASIECRAPFLDHELVELTARMPSNLKVRGFTMKYLLKKVVQPWVPDEILHRKKRGFGAPMGAWLKNSLESLVHDTLSADAIRSRGFFDPGVVQKTVDDHRQSRADHTDHLLSLITFELWCRIYLDGKVPSGAGEIPSQLAMKS
ncbi:MAG TPA: asparagine synthase (glutamine-hydrolyzing) [Terriglobales bacterium]|nr:asparagine synthase (glutamine-hydrolyzing) [Terriglobales bacterium]